MEATVHCKSCSDRGVGNGARLSPFFRVDNRQADPANSGGRENSAHIATLSHHTEATWH